MEKWIPIANQPWHEVSDLGRVRSVERSQPCKDAHGGMAEKKLKSRILSPFRCGKYLGIRFSMGSSNRYIHRLVADAFIPKKLGAEDVNHKNGIRSDNRAENLEWVTPSENMLHSTHVLGNKAGQWVGQGVRQ